MRISLRGRILVAMLAVSALTAVVTARAKGLSDNQVLYGHVFRNAMLIIIAGFPAALLGVFFTGSFLIEVIFNLDGLGLLSFESVINRDYPVMVINPSSRNRAINRDSVSGCIDKRAAIRCLGSIKSISALSAARFSSC